MTDFLEQQDDDDEYIFVDEYVDDGVSGTTDEERESFPRNYFRKGCRNV